VTTLPHGARASVRLQDEPPAKSNRFEYSCIVHPAVLEGCFTGLYAAFGGNIGRHRLQSIVRLDIGSRFSQLPSRELFIKSKFEPHSFGRSIGSFNAFDEAGTLQIAVSGAKFQTPGNDLDSVAVAKKPCEVRKLASQLIWKPDIERLRPDTMRRILCSTAYTTRQSILGLPVCDPGPARMEDIVAGWLHLYGHKYPTQAIVEVSTGPCDQILAALKALGGEDESTPLCSRYTRLVPEHEWHHDGEREWSHREHFVRQIYCKSSTDVLLSGTSLADQHVIIVSSVRSPRTKPQEHL
jgi:hypothetical protein